MNEPRTNSSCPGSETLASFAEGKLSTEERAAVIEHLTTCPACYETIREVGILRDELEPRAREVTPFRRRPALIAAGVAALVLIFLATPLRERFFGSDELTPVALLAAAVADQRPIEPRLAGFDHAPLRPVTRGERTGSYELLAAAARIEQEMSDPPTASDEHALGLAKLLLGEWDEAVDLLLRAVEAEPSASRLSDVSAAHLARGEALGNPTDPVEAFEWASKALEEEALFPPALFNRALALQKSEFADDEAFRAWQEYLNVDESSRWAEEARRHLEALDRRDDRTGWDQKRIELELALLRNDTTTVGEIVAMFPGQSRRWAMADLLGGWGRAVLEDRPEAVFASMEDLRTVAAGLKQAGDSSLSGIVSNLDSAAPSDRHRSAQAAFDFRESKDLYIKGEYERALGRLGNAKTMVSDGPLATAVALLDASVHYVRRDLPAARESLAHVTAGEPALLAEGEWLLGMIEAIDGSPFRALEHFRSSRRSFANLGDRESAAAVQALAADCLDLLGERDEAWRERIAGFRGTIVSRSDRNQRQATLFALAHQANQRGRHHFAALVCGMLVADTAGKAGNPERSIDALLERALAYAGTGNEDAAIADLAAARGHLVAITDARVRERSELFVARAAVEVLDGIDEAEALRESDGAILIAERLGDRLQIARLRLARGRLMRSAARIPEAEMELQYGIEAIESERNSIDDEAMRVSHFETSRDLFDELIDLLIEDRRSEDAFKALQQTRARSLRERQPNTARSAAEEVAVISWAVLPKRTVSFLRKGSILETRTAAIGSDELKRKIDRFRLGLDDGVVARDLFDLLIAPLQKELTRGEPLILVPDKSLHSLPFAALREAAGEPYLFELHPFAISPSPSIRGLPSWRTPLSILAIGNPRVGPSLRSSLRQLPAAEREATEIAAMYERATLLTGFEPTPARILREAPAHEVLHFAGHAESGTLSPALVLASGPSDGGVLEARHLQNADLEGISLAVIAGCGSADGTIRASEGVDSLATALLSAGIPWVITFSGAIEDESTRALSRSIHRRIREGASPLIAVRDAQLAILREQNGSQDSPSWAFISIAVREP